MTRSQCLSSVAEEHCMLTRPKAESRLYPREQDIACPLNVETKRTL